MDDVLRAWGRVLSGYRPALAIEITRECPLQCPGCYAYNDDHLGGPVTLRQVRDYQGQALIDGVLGLVDEYRPVHVSIVGGEPLVRYRELDTLLPLMSSRGLHVQLVTSAVREIPKPWARIPRLSIVISIDGLQPEHDARRAPATYDRILKHIAGHYVTIHCTITSQQVRRAGYLDEFLAFWSARPETRRIWMSLYTPQVGERSEEMLNGRDRSQAIADLMALRRRYSKLDLSEELLNALANPPSSPRECTFARMVTSVSADLETRITPCMFGGAPDCANCGCMASAGLAGLARRPLLGVVPVGALIDASVSAGRHVRRWRDAGRAALRKARPGYCAPQVPGQP
jgi:organic radical activating enzyme